MKKSNLSQKTNKMTKSKQTMKSTVVDWVMNTLADYIPENKVDDARNSLLSRKGELDKIVSNKTSEKRKKDPNAPKRGKSSYIFFCVEQREKIKKSHPEMEAKDIIKELGNRWKDLSDEKKVKYVKMAEEDKERFSHEMGNYTPPPESATSKKSSGPKRGLTSYIFFCKDRRDTIKGENPEMSTKDITAELGRLWKSLSEEEKAPYVELANNDKHRYESEKSGESSSSSDSGSSSNSSSSKKDKEKKDKKDKDRDREKDKKRSRKEKKEKKEKK